MNSTTYGYVIYDKIGDLYYNRIDRCLKPLKQTTAIYATENQAKKVLVHVEENIRKQMYRNENNVDKNIPVYYSTIKDYHPTLQLVICKVELVVKEFL